MRLWAEVRRGGPVCELPRAEARGTSRLSAGGGGGTGWVGRQDLYCRRCRGGAPGQVGCRRGRGGGEGVSGASRFVLSARRGWGGGCGGGAAGQVGCRREGRGGGGVGGHVLRGTVGNAACGRVGRAAGAIWLTSRAHLSRSQSGNTPTQ